MEGVALFISGFLFGVLMAFEVAIRRWFREPDPVGQKLRRIAEEVADMERFAGCRVVNTSTLTTASGKFQLTVASQAKEDGVGE